MRTYSKRLIDKYTVKEELPAPEPCPNNDVIDELSLIVADLTSKIDQIESDKETRLKSNITATVQKRDGDGRIKELLILAGVESSNLIATINRDSNGSLRTISISNNTNKSIGLLTT